MSAAQHAYTPDDHDTASEAPGAPPVDDTTAAPAPPPASDAPLAAQDLAPEQKEFLVNMLLRPDAFTLVVESLPDTPTRTLLKLWGSLREIASTACASSAQARPEPQLPAYAVEPGPLPDEEEVVLTPDEVFDVFDVLLEGIQSWERSTDAVEDASAYRRLERLLRAQLTMTEAALHAMRPLTRAHEEDHAAARAWEFHRWLTRGRIAGERRKEEAAARQQKEATGE